MISSVREFYIDKCVLITGGMGFIGKLLVAKLLRQNDVKEILLLSRPKRNKTIAQRWKDLFDGFLFQKIDAEIKSKVRLVTGDMGSMNLSLSLRDRNYVTESVHVIIHCAAELNMDGRFRKTMLTNVRGTKLLMDLAMDAKHLESFVYISTAYSQSPRLHTKEIFYESPMDFRLAIALCERFDDDEQLEPLTNKLFAPLQNIYSFSKAVTEDMVRTYQHKLPIAVIRPSMGKIHYHMLFRLKTFQARLSCGNLLRSCPWLL